MWHELVLAGVGGTTVREAKSRLTVQEARQWVLYMRKHGSVALGRKIDRGFALMGHLLCAGMHLKTSGKTPTMEDFLPHSSVPEQADIEDVFTLFKSLRKKERTDDGNP